MSAVEAMMKKSLHQFAKEAVASYPDVTRWAWLQKTLGMLGLAGATIWWTWETEDALQKMTAGSQSALKVSFCSSCLPLPVLRPWENRNQKEHVTGLEFRKTRKLGCHKA